MATTFPPAAVAPFGAITIHRVITVLWGAADTLCAWNKRRRTIAVLRALNPTQLDDVGLTRSNVDDFARKYF